MKRKIVKAAVLCMLMVIAMMAITACGSNKTMTLSEYLRSGDRIIAYWVDGEDIIGKDTFSSDVYIFEGDKVTKHEGALIDFGDAANMTEDEILEYIDKYTFGDIISYDSYRFVAYTDSTGNNILAEGIQLNAGNGDYEDLSYASNYYKISKHEVYDSTFTALTCNGSLSKPSHLVFKDAPNLILDDEDTDELIIDP